MASCCNGSSAAFTRSPRARAVSCGGQSMFPRCVLFSLTVPPPGKSLSAKRQNLLAATIAHLRELCHAIGCNHLT